MPFRKLFLCRLGLGAMLCLAGLPALAGLDTISAESAIVVEATTGKVLYEKDADALRYPASTTKIMTALLFIEKVGPKEMITAPADVESVGGSSLHLKPYEQVPAEDLLYAILLRSANDAAYTAAVYVAGSEKKFAEMMTERARELGCTGTHFTNPHGLHDPNHYTTARDLAIIAREAMKNPRFAQVVGTEHRLIARSMNSEDIFITTHNKFLKDRTDATGVKTGWTVPAGRCFVGSATRDDLSVITVVLKSQNWEGDSDTLADWAFAEWTAAPVIKEGQVLMSVPVKNGTRLTVPVAACSPLVLARQRGADVSYKVVSSDVRTSLPIKTGALLGTVTVQDQDGAQHVLDVVATADVDVARFALTSGPVGPVTVLIAISLVGGAWFVRRRALSL
jgi:D-alanyl-D-alanine carboxypeptidase (penicillin-binding protein 5/6)